MKIPNPRAWTSISIEQEPSDEVFKRAPHRRQVIERAKRQRDASKDETIREIFQKILERLS